MMFAVVYSKEDIASYTLYNAFKKVVETREIDYIIFHEYPEHVVYADKVDEELPDNIDTIIFLSRHSAESDIPTISVHTPGNFGENRLGGNPNQLAIANPCLIGEILRCYKSYTERFSLGYNVTLEVTHHGPTDNSIPSVFVEIGPKEVNWIDKRGASLIAYSVVEAIEKYMNNRNCVRCLGIGGPHYAPNFTRYLLKNGDVGIGHIISKYVLTSFNKNFIDLALSSNNGVDKVLISWKGLKGGVRKEVLNYLSDLGYEVIKL